MATISGLRDPDESDGYEFAVKIIAQFEKLGGKKIKTRRPRPISLIGEVKVVMTKKGKIRVNP